MDDILQRTYFNNTVQDYLIACAIIVGSILVLRLFKRTLLKRFEVLSSKTQSKTDDRVVKVIERFLLPILSFLCIYVGLKYLTLSAKADRIIEVSIAILVTYFILRLISTVLDHVLHSYVRRQTDGEEKIKQVAGVMLLVNIVVWGLGFLALFDNLGYNVTTIVAGLGIGGIAVALAAQNILGDLFNYFVIFFDRPFAVGDFIVLDDKNGTVEYIGIKTTRLKSLSGEQLILPNSVLTQSRLHNFKRMERRRISFTTGVSYQTTAQQLHQIPSLLKKIVESQSKVTLDRTHLLAFAESSITFETVYFVESSDFNTYMDIQQAINFQLFEEFQKHKIDFAYPARTVLMWNEAGEEKAGNRYSEKTKEMSSTEKDKDVR